MKKTLMIFGLLSILITDIFAGGFYAISYGQSLDAKTFTSENGNTIDFHNLESLHIKIGGNSFPIEEQGTNNFGGYLDGALGSSNSIDYGEELVYDNMLLNLGLTYCLNNYFVLFGGMGLSHSSAEFKDEEKIRKNEFNVNTGLMMYLYESRFGLIVDYNSIPKVVSVGFTYRY